jgi:hypothetical protein
VSVRRRAWTPASENVWIEQRVSDRSRRTRLQVASRVFAPLAEQERHMPADFFERTDLDFCSDYMFSTRALRDALPDIDRSDLHGCDDDGERDAMSRLLVSLGLHAIQET